MPPRRTIMRSQIQAVLLTLLLVPRAHSQVNIERTSTLPAQRALTNVQWQQDLAAMQDGMRKTHKDLYHTVSQAKLEAAFRQLSVEIPSLGDDAITVRLMEIAAMVRDGHSGVDVSFRNGNTHVAVWLARYDNGLYVRVAAKEYPQAVGARVMAIGGVPWQEALRRIDSIVDCDPGNDGQRWSWQPSLYLSDPLILHGLGMSASNTEVSYTLEKDGKSFDLTLAPTLNASDLVTLPGPVGWLDARKKAGVQPLEHPWTEPLQLAYVPGAKAIYVQFNEVELPEKETADGLALRFAQFSETHDADRLVLDLRHNPGGDNTILRPFLVSLIRSKFNRRGGMFVLIGPTTFSAAQNFVDRLENYADVIFVGQPTSNNVNFFGDPVGFELPNSHLDVEMAHLWWQDKDPRDRRTATFPEIAISEGSFADYVDGKDAALDFCLHASTPASFEDLMQAGANHGKTAALAGYRDYESDPKHRYAETLEKRLNALGYQALQANGLAQAIVLFQVNAETHPDSANAFDSLGEAEEKASNTSAAVQAYQRSLQLNPQNRHAKEALERLQSKR